MDVVDESEWPCPDPRFEWLPAIAAWSACTNCGRLAWDHEQADPLADMRNTFQALRDGGPLQPPAMRS